jgi:hypothetical protein
LVEKRRMSDEFKPGTALVLTPRQCESAWNKDPVFGVIGIQSEPRG